MGSKAHPVSRYKLAEAKRLSAAMPPGTPVVYYPRGRFPGQPARRGRIDGMFHVTAAGVVVVCIDNLGVRLPAACVECEPCDGPGDDK